MVRWLILALILIAAPCQAAVLVQSANGQYSSAYSTLAAAAVAPGVRSVVVTSALSAVQSNISSASLHAWPSDRAFEVKKGGSVNPTTKFTGIPYASPRWFGAKGDGSADDSAAIMKAIASTNKLVSGADVYRVDSTIYIPSKNGFSWEFDRKAIAGVNAFNILWYGGAAPVVEVSGPPGAGLPIGYAIDLHNLSINGKAGTTRATIGLSLGKLASDYNVLVKFLNATSLHVENCRIGLLLGGDTAVADDIAHLNFKSMVLANNTDFGLYGYSGNVANTLFENPLFSGNGYAPTLDSLNSTGGGVNAFLVAGEYTFIAGSSDGDGVSKPATADFKVVFASLKINGWWSDTTGPFLIETGPVNMLSLKNVRHYSGQMTDVNTPTSLDVTAKTLLDGCVFFGDVVLSGGQAGSITSVTTHFEPPEFRRPTLGIGKFRGDLITNQGALVSINETGNYAQIKLGGNTTRPFESIGMVPSQLLLMNSTAGKPFLQALGGASGESGMTMSMYAANGAVTQSFNCYNSSSGKFKALTVGPAYLADFGNNSTMNLYRYNFPNTTTEVDITSFTRVFGILEGLGGYGNEVTMKVPTLAANPTFDSGNFWEGSIYYNSVTKKYMGNTGGSTWTPLN